MVCRRTTILLALILTALGSRPAAAQLLGGESRYISPPESVRELFDRDKNYATLDAVSPDGRHFLVPLTSELSTLEKMSKETYRLAMLEHRPKVNREWRLDTFGIYGFRIFSLDSRQFTDVELPPDTLVTDLMFSPDGRQVAFLAHLPQATEVWTADVATGKASPLSESNVMATLAARPEFRRSYASPSRMLQWTPRGTVLTLLVPSERGPEPSRTIPAGPIIRRTRDKPSPTRTLRFLLQDEHDVELFRYYTTAQLAELSAGRPARKIGAPAMYLEFSLSPDGSFILAEKIVEPFSYIVGYSAFPRTLEVMDLEGKILSTLREIPLQEDATRRTPEVEADFPREVAWYPEGSRLGFLWNEEKGEEDPAPDNDRPRRDRIVTLNPPFELSQAQIRAQSKDDETSFSGISYSAEGHFAFVTTKTGGGDGDDSSESIVCYDLSREPPEAYVVAKDYDPEDVVNLPGEILTRTTSNGIRFALLSGDGEKIYLQGPGYRENFSPRPFIDRVSIRSGEKERVFEGSEDVYEQPLTPLDPDLKQMIVSRESKTDFPDSTLWTGDGAAADLTHNQDPFPEITAAKRVDFEFTRRDGLTVQGRISLPVGYQEGQRVPALFWTYPREYGSFEDYRNAALRSRNHNAFTHLSYLRWSDIWLTQGYAVVYPDVPIIKKGRAYNDNFIQHLVDTLYAAIRKVDELGYVDIDRIGHGGHSYGAFTTANLLAHTPFFKAGIAGNGAYNRSLTPLGFQSERRFIWDSHGLYLQMSPFFNADHIDTPLLMYHGADDNNSGTFPIQSDRLMQALTGLGKTAVLYKYPFESHGPRAKKTYLDLWARWLEWFDRYVKEPDKTETE